MDIQRQTPSVHPLPLWCSRMRALLGDRARESGSVSAGWLRLHWRTEEISVGSILEHTTIRGAIESKIGTKETKGL